MSHRALSGLHIIPPKQTINGAYYRDNILAKTCSDATNRTANIGSILEGSMLADMSDFLFMQDGAPPHTANLTQRWFVEHFPRFQRKVELLGNSQDLNPIENLWSMLKDCVGQMANATKLEDLILQVKSAWADIDPDILEFGL
ncbi:hypothetical protein LOD99_5667 [Oopsacas minuta]|uniref:Tc1-like transposase DDE domain-containing protein n=1 Tax=Oopsacas minuta TaxID=111878 RepID=A0AAV7JQ88_9METZ|nr:hypothetical protein LOD99_5667 [Oopsacas minuta]